MSSLSGITAGLDTKARTLGGGVHAPSLRWWAARLFLVVCLLLVVLHLPALPLYGPRVSVAATVADPVDATLKEPTLSPTKRASSYTGTISPATTATLSTERPLFSAVGTVSLPFGGLIHQDGVFIVGRSAALLDALRKAALSLDKHTAAHIGAHELPRRIALAMAAYSPMVSKSITSLPASAGAKEGAGTTKPANTGGQARYNADELLTVMVTLQAPLPMLDSRLHQTMQHPDVWDLYANVLHQMQGYVEEGRDLITRAATLREEHGAHMDEVFMNRITRIADALDALWMYVHILPNLRTTWDNPALVQKQMQRALTLAPQLPLLWCALGEAQIQMDVPQQALDSLNKALQFAPDLARALYARGLAHLRLQQSALAENDLTAALNLRPHTVHWLRARGAVRMIREDYGPMCEDFSAACALGDCDGLITARKRDLCLPQADAPAATAIDAASTVSPTKPTGAAGPTGTLGTTNPTKPTGATEATETSAPTDGGSAAAPTPASPVPMTPAPTPTP